MPRPPIPQEEINRVKLLWDKHNRPNAAKLRSLDPNKYSERKYQQWIAEARRGFRELPADPLVYPWGEGWPKEDPDHIECVYRLYRASLQRPEFPLTVSTVAWGLRLQKIFSGSARIRAADQDVELLHYAFDFGLRERACESLNIPLDTSDLDGLVTYRVWESAERFEEYLEAVDSGLVPQYDPVTMLKDEAAIYGWDDVVETFVIGAFWPLSRAHGFRFVGSGDSEEDGLGDKGAYIKAAIRSINVLHMVSGEPDVLTAIRHWIRVLAEDLEAAAQKATVGSQLEEYFNNWLEWWREIIPTLMQWVNDGIFEDQDRDQNSELEGVEHEGLNKTAE